VPLREARTAVQTAHKLVHDTSASQYSDDADMLSHAAAAETAVATAAQVATVHILTYLHFLHSVSNTCIAHC
jgi:hypothetical protein